MKVARVLLTTETPMLLALRSERTGYWLFCSHLLTLWGLALSNGLLGLTIVWAGFRGRLLDWTRVSQSPLRTPLIAYVVCYVASVGASVDFSVSGPELKSLISLATLILGILIVRTENQIRQLWSALAVMISVLSVLGIAQFYLTDYGPISDRIPSLFSHYMTFSGVLLFGIFFLLGKLLRKGGWKQAKLWLALGFLVFTLSLTLTRGAWIAAASVTVVALVLSARRSPASRFVVVGVLGSFLVFAFAAPRALKDRARSITDLQNTSNYDRVCMIRAGFDMIEEKPVFGIGPAMVEERYPIYRDPTAPRLVVKHLHNTLVHLAAERGLASVAAYCWLMIASLLMAWRGFVREGGFEGGRADLYLMVLFSVLGFNLAGLFEANWRDTEIQRLMLTVMIIPHSLRSQQSGGSLL